MMKRFIVSAKFDRNIYQLARRRINNILGNNEGLEFRGCKLTVGIT